MSTENNSTFQRAPHDKEHPFAIIARDLIRDESISPNCRWLLIYMLSMKDGWKMKIAQIYQHVKNFMGRDEVYKTVDEAIGAGYIKREDVRVGNLRRGCIYYVSESPIFKKCFRHPEMQDTEARYTGDQEALRRSIEKDIPKEVREEASPPTPPTPLVSFGKPISPNPMISFGKKVKMSQEDYDSLKEKYGEAKLKDYIEAVDDYHCSVGKEKKDWAATIRGWERREAQYQPKEKGKATKGAEEANKGFIAEVIKKNNAPREIEVTESGVRIRVGIHEFPLKFNQEGFKEQVTGHLHRLGLVIPAQEKF